MTVAVGTALLQTDGAAADVLPYPGDDPSRLDGLQSGIRDARQALAHAFDVLRDGGAGLDAAWHGTEAELAADETLRLVSACRQAVQRADGAAGAVADHTVIIRQVRVRIDAAREQWAQGRDQLVTIKQAEITSGVAPLMCLSLSGHGPDDCEFARQAIVTLTAQARQQMSEAQDRWRAQVRVAEQSAQECIAALLRACAGSDLDTPGLAGTHVGLADTLGVGGLVFDDRMRARFGRGTWETLSAEQRAYFLALAKAELGQQPGATGWSLAAAWRGLDPLCRQALIHDEPARWGNADGLPAADRDQANRLALVAAVSTIRQDTAGVHPPLPPMGTDPDTSAATVTAALAAAGYSPARIRAARGTLAVSSQLTRAAEHSGAAPVQLLIFDPDAYDGRGRAAIALGDVATADHVAFTVPGMTSQVPGYLSTQLSDAIRLSDAAGSLSTDSTATVAYIGYRAPDLGWDVADQDLADAGAPVVSADIDGLRMMRSDGPAHLTVIAHSYGSTTTATAFARDSAGVGPGVTDLVLIGSPGAGRAATAADLDLPPAHVWVGSASSDPVTTVVQRAQDRTVQHDVGCAAGGSGGVLVGAAGGPVGAVLGAVGGCALGALGVETTAEVIGADLGQDPAGVAFGGTRFASETPSNSQLNVDNHTQYYQAHTESLANITHIVVGDYQGVTTVAPRPESGTHYDGRDPAAAHEPVFPAPGG